MAALVRSGLLSTDRAMTAKAENRNRTGVEPTAPIAVVMLSLNEAHNMPSVIANLSGWAQEIFLVDSYSQDDTVDIAISGGVQVVQRRFQGFGDQWNYAMTQLPIKSPWTMKLDPDERITDELKASIEALLANTSIEGIRVVRRLWFMGRPLPVRQTITRGWRTGSCRFTDVPVNEHPIVEGELVSASGDLEHHDSPNLHHWYEKQNWYSSAEALAALNGNALSASLRLFGSGLERRMWVKAHLHRVPFLSLAVFLHCFVWQGAWKSGRVGMAWSRLRGQVYFMRVVKLREMKLRGHKIELPLRTVGTPHPDAEQADRPGSPTKQSQKS